jgi:tetratricopeptide (TPR) repeat protein
MGLRFRKSVRLGLGVWLNVSGKSAGLSFGGAGFRYSINTSGRRTSTASIPGTGLSWTSTSNAHASGTRRGEQAPAPAEAHSAITPRTRWWLASAAEWRFYEGVLAFVNGDLSKAAEAFEAAGDQDRSTPSNDLFAGVIAARLGDSAKAISHLERVVASETVLPDDLMRKYLPLIPAEVRIDIDITPRVAASLEVGSLSAALLLAELHQAAGRRDEAIGVLQQLHETDPSDLALQLSLCDLLYEDGDDEGVIETAGVVPPINDVTTATVHLKAKALARRGLTNVALEMLRACLKRPSFGYAELLREIRYDLATFYEASGKAKLARREWERLYAADPKYRDVAQRVAPPT